MKNLMIIAIAVFVTCSAMAFNNPGPAPELNIIAPIDWTLTDKASIDTYGTASSESGRVVVFVNGSFAGKTNWFKTVELTCGTNEIQFVAVNGSTNTTTVIRRVICSGNNIEDNEAPEIKEVSPEDGYSTLFPKVKMEIEAEDNIGVASVTVNGELAKRRSDDEWIYLADLVEGTNLMEIVATDAAGNQSTKSVGYIRQEMSIDTNAPVLNVEAPENGLETDAEKIEVYGTASDDSGFVLVKVNGKCAGTTNWFKKVKLLPGTNLIEITAFDISSNVTEEVIAVIRTKIEDNEAPEIKEVSPEDGYSTLFPKVKMEIEAEDNIGVASVTVNGELAKRRSDGEWIYLADLIVGANLMEIVATDAAGNQSTKNVGYIRQETNIAELAVVTTNLHNGVVSNVYKASLHARGGVKPYKWTLIEGQLPEMFKLMENGDIIGATDETGVYEIKVQVADANNSAATSLVLQIEIKGTGRKSQFITKTLVDAMRKHAYSTKLLLKSGDTNCNWKFSAESDLPDGMNLTSDGNLEGTPKEAGIYEIKIKAENGSEIVKEVISLEVADCEEGGLIVDKVEQAKIMVNWRKRLRNGTNNQDRIMLKLKLLCCGDESCLSNKDFAVNIGNFAVPLETKEYKKNGKIVKFENKYQNKTELQVKGKAKLDDNGIMHLMVNIKNADISELLNIQNGNCKKQNEQVALEVIVGTETAHSILQMQLRGRENKKSIMKLQK